VLTDEKVKANYEKYGSPDGPGTMQVGIALPSFFLNKKNHVAILAFFFIVLLVIVPSIVIYWYSDLAKYDVDGVRFENK
jgi:translocation protein SEC63